MTELFAIRFSRLLTSLIPFGECVGVVGNYCAIVFSSHQDGMNHLLVHRSVRLFAMCRMCREWCRFRHRKRLLLAS